MSSELQELIKQELKENHGVGTIEFKEGKAPEPTKIIPAPEPTTDSDSGGNVDVKAKKVSWFKKLYEEKLSERLIACRDPKTQQHSIWEYAFEMLAKYGVSAFKASVWSAMLTAVLLALIASDKFGVLLELIKNIP